MDWNDIRHFLAVARTGGLSAAARQTGIAQATLGRRIQALEASLGVVLFERLNSGYVLTPAGRELLGRAEHAEAAMLAVARGADAAADELRGTVRLATAETFATHIVAPALGGLMARHPALRLEFVTGVRTLSLSRREADLALRIQRPDSGDHVRRKVGTVGFGLYAAAGAPVPADPWAADLLAWDEGSGSIPAAEWMAERGRGRVVATATSVTVQMALAKAGLGAAILPCFLADPDPGLVRLLPPAEVGSLDLWLVAHADLARAPRIRAVLDFLAETCATRAAQLRGV
ncbi:MAG TPA: LysR family transcriptional regulator [Azospirillaceae bacterium]|nr:LysR family transcriptional regulator [Azospirillaceae bacterium]